jgi:GH24 family phage-related lysozyme (muramidase)
MAYIKLKDPTAFIIKKQVIQVEKLVGQKNKFKEVAFKKKIKLTESLRREETEESLEKYKDRGSKIKGFSTPRLGFLDSIKNFLFSVLFGALALKLLPYLPQLKGVLITTLKVGNFAVEFAGTILNAMVTFIDKVYGIIDFGKQQAKILGGDSGVKNYEKMLGMSNKVINTMLIAGMLFSDLISLKAQTDSNQNAIREIGETIAGEIKKRQGFRASIQAAGRVIGGVAKSAGIVLLVGLASSILGELSFQQRKFTKKLENDVAYQLKKAERDPNPITRTLKLVAYNAALPGLRFFNFVSTGVGTLLDIIGAPFRYLGELVNLGIMSLTGDASGIKKQRENLGKLDARIREQIREVVNTLSLGTLAKEKGSFGSLYGSGATKAMGYASGGAVTREGQEAIGGVITRTGGKKAISRTLEIPMSPLNPGSSVGGQMNYVDPDTKEQTKISNIETFFPNPKDSKYINSYEYLTGSYNVVSSGEFLKPFLQMPIKIIMGNGSSEGDYNSLASSVNSLFVTILRRTLVPGARKSLADELGFVDIFSWARDSIRVSMIDPVNEILKSLKEQFMLKSGDGPGLVKDAAAGAESGASGASDGGGGEGIMMGTSFDNTLAKLLKSYEGLRTAAYKDAVGIPTIGMGATYYPPGFRLSGKVRMGQTITEDEALMIKMKHIAEHRNRLLRDISATEYAKVPDNIKAALESKTFNYGSLGSTLAGLVKNGIKTKNYQSVADYFRNTLAKHDGGLNSWRRNDEAGLIETGTSQRAKVSFPKSSGGQAVAEYQGEGKKSTKGLEPSNMKNIQSISHPDTGSGYTVAGLKDQQGRPAVFSQKAADAFGRMMSDSKGVVRGSDIASSQRSRQKNAAVGGVSNSNHLYGNALDIHGSSQTWMRRNGKKYGWIVNDYDGSHGGHFDFKGYKEGGPVNKTDYALTHPGEYVVDADSVKLFGIQFYDIINKVEMVSQRKNASNMLISILSQYTEDGFPETEDDYEYPVPPPQVIMIPGPVVEIASSSGSGSGGGGGDDDPSKDGLEQR